MTLPSTWPTVPVFGTYLRVDGTPNEGSVWFETSQRVVVLDENGLTIGVVPRRIIADLDADGHFALTLPCTDAGAQPTGWTWQVFERFNSGQPVYSIEVPQALIGVGINLAQYPHAVPVPVAPPVVSYLTTADIGVTVADQVGVDNAIATANAAAGTASAAQAAAASAVTTANDASAVANAIDGKAQSALDNSNAAVTTANAASATATAAQNTANAIDGKAQSALDASAAATTTANDAKTTADGIAGTANTALANANAAVTTANAAQTTANAALPATANAVSASKWAAPRTISLTGPVTGSASVDGSADKSIATVVTDKSIGLGKLDPTGSTAGQVPVSQGAAAAPVWGWASPGFKNWLINGNFDFWQRGTSVSVPAGSAIFLADRFNNQSMGGSTAIVSMQAFAAGQTNVPDNPSYFIRHVVTSVAGAGNGYRMQHKVENVTQSSANTYTVSFWAKADAARSIAVQFTQTFGPGGSANVDIFGAKISLTTAWQKFTITATCPSVSGATVNAGNAFVVQIWFDAGSNYNAVTGSLGQQSGTFDIAQMQMEEGSAATPFDLRPLAIELALCQRYYETNYDTNVAPGTTYGTATAANGAEFVYLTVLPSGGRSVGIPIKFKASKRTVPTVTAYSPVTGATGKARDIVSNTDFAVGNLYALGVNGLTLRVDYTSASTSVGLLAFWTADAEL